MECSSNHQFSAKGESQRASPAAFQQTLVSCGRKVSRAEDWAQVLAARVAGLQRKLNSGRQISNAFSYQRPDSKKGLGWGMGVPGVKPTNTFNLRVPLGLPGLQKWATTLLEYRAPRLFQDDTEAPDEASALG